MVGILGVISVTHALIPEALKIVMDAREGSSFGRSVHLGQQDDPT